MYSAARDFAPSSPHKSIWDTITDAVKNLGKWIDGHAPPRKVSDLYGHRRLRGIARAPSAFADEQSLMRNLVHERVHIDQHAQEKVTNNLVTN
ncbi:hypothetical protein [Nocardia africana]